MQGRSSWRFVEAATGVKSAVGEARRTPTISPRRRQYGRPFGCRARGGGYGNVSGLARSAWRITGRGSWPYSYGTRRLLRIPPDLRSWRRSGRICSTSPQRHHGRRPTSRASLCRGQSRTIRVEAPPGPVCPNCGDLRRESTEVDAQSRTPRRSGREGGGGGTSTHHRSHPVGAAHLSVLAKSLLGGRRDRFEVFYPR